MTHKYNFQLQFKKKDIRKWAARHQSEASLAVVTKYPKKVLARGYYTKAEFIEYCYWKSPRTQPRVAQNSEEFVEAVTSIALSTPNERLRIEVLRLLYGVNWPGASVLLHFGHCEPYPIIDYRALWSVGIDKRMITYNFDIWWEYTLFCRNLANESAVSMRELDLALWQYSKENQ